MKIKIFLILLITLSAYALYFYPIQKYFAEKYLEEYMVLQGTSDTPIHSKKILKDYKIGGYTISIVYEDDLDHWYEYLYFPGEKGLNESMICAVFNNQNEQVDPKVESVKYPPIK